MKKQILAFVVGTIGLALFWSVDWKLSIAVILFGWCMNLENSDKYIKKNS